MSMLRQLQVIAFGLLGAVLFFAAGNNVLAMGTPDGETPAEETVCDGLSGAAFGLCNTYCEAIDCDSDFPSASQKACDRVAGNFERHSEGEPLPCEIEEPLDCPCQELWADAAEPFFCTGQYDIRDNCDITDTTDCLASDGSGTDLGLTANAMSVFTKSEILSQ